MFIPIYYPLKYSNDLSAWGTYEDEYGMLLPVDVFPWKNTDIIE